MTIEKKKIPPIVPKKKPGLKTSKIDVSKDIILLPHLKPRQEEPIKHESNDQQTQPIDKNLINQISLDSQFLVPKHRKHEPKVLRLDDVLKPVIRNDIKINHTPLLQPILKKQPPIVKPKPKLELKAKSISNSLQFTESIQPIDNTFDFLNETMQRRIQLSNGIPLPGLATKSKTTSSFNTPKSPSMPYRSNTLPNLQSGSSQPLTHPNKSRAKGPRRRLPTQISQTSSSNNTSSQCDISTQKKKPPVPPKKKQIVF